MRRKGPAPDSGRAVIMTVHAVGVMIRDRPASMKKM